MTLDNTRIFSQLSDEEKAAIPRKLRLDLQIEKIESYHENGKPTNYIAIYTKDGNVTHVDRPTALARAKAVLDMLLAETGGADPVDMDRDIYICHEMFKAVIQNGRENGKKYKSKAIKHFEDQIKQVEKNWKHIHDEVRTTITKVSGFKSSDSKQLD